MEVIDVEVDIKPSPIPVPPQPQPSQSSVPVTSNYGGLGIDVCFEASKLPLDVAIFNSARASGGDDKIRKHLQAVLVIGGSALIPGMAHALESRQVAETYSHIRYIELLEIGCRQSPLHWSPAWTKYRSSPLQKRSTLVY
jgi:hypothetical protein